MDIKLGREYGYYMHNKLVDIFVPSEIDNGRYIGTVNKIYSGQTLRVGYTHSLITANYIPLFLEVKNTRLAKKMYPNAVEEDGMLVLQC